MESSKRNNKLSRRSFHKLSMAAFGGAVVGAMSGGCRSSEPAEAGKQAALLLEEPHVCRGLNTCQGKGAGGDNQCAGTGSCATAEHHACHGENACKGQGGCGAAPGQNACKGQGDCGVPLSAGAWTKARAAFEKQAAAQGMKVGGAPN